jgi:hypothetical protein
VLESVLPVAHEGATMVPAASGGAGVGTEAYEIRDAAGAVAGRMVELAADRPPWAARVYGFEVTVQPPAERGHRVAPLPRSPAVQRDVALVLPEGVAAADVSDTLRGAVGGLLERLFVFDEYRGAPLEPGTRSVAWRLVFREEGRTLREQEVDAVLAKGLDEVERRHRARRREA